MHCWRSAGFSIPSVWDLQGTCLEDLRPQSLLDSPQKVDSFPSRSRWSQSWGPSICDWQSFLVLMLFFHASKVEQLWSETKTMSMIIYWLWGVPYTKMRLLLSVIDFLPSSSLWSLQTKRAFIDKCIVRLTNSCSLTQSSVNNLGRSRWSNQWPRHLCFSWASSQTTHLTDGHRHSPKRAILRHQMNKNHMAQQRLWND